MELGCQERWTFDKQCKRWEFRAEADLPVQPMLGYFFCFAGDQRTVIQGVTALTRISRRAHSQARIRVKWLRAALDIP